jgi:hypothetical protein
MADPGASDFGSIPLLLRQEHIEDMGGHNPPTRRTATMQMMLTDEDALSTGMSRTAFAIEVFYYANGSDGTAYTWRPTNPSSRQTRLVMQHMSAPSKGNHAYYTYNRSTNTFTCEPCLGTPSANARLPGPSHPSKKMRCLLDCYSAGPASSPG